MGQCVGGSVATPSAFQLCRAFEQQSRDSSGHGDVSSIWRLVPWYKIRALGQIVSAWAHRQIDGPTARWRLWLLVLQWHPLDSHARHELSWMMDAVFLCRAFEDARVTAMRDLGLEGARALPEEVHASFHRKARAIFECWTQQQQQYRHHDQQQHQHQQQRQQQQQQQQLHEPADPCLELVQLCLCVEVVRHLQASCIGQPGRGALLAPRPPPPSRLRLMEMTPEIPASMSSIMRRRYGAHTPGTYSSGTIAMGGNEKREQIRGLTLEEIDQHCPKVHRDAEDGGRCPVCLTPSVPGEVVRSLPCEHALHQECCEAWLVTADTCPICRFQIVPN